MDFFTLFQYFLVLLVPGLLGALGFSIAARCKSEISIKVALILDLITFVIMIIGLFIFRNITTFTTLINDLNFITFSRTYILLSTAITVIIGTIAGLIRRLFFWIRR